MTTLQCRIVNDYDDLSREFLIYGPDDQLRQLTRLHAHAGTLVNATAPVTVTVNQSRLRMRVRNSIITGGAPRPLPTGSRLAGSPAAFHHDTANTTRSNRPPRPRRTPTAAIVTAIAGIATGLLTGVAYLLGVAAEFTVTHAAAILVVLALAAIVAGAFTRRSRRRHCPGC
ncbi:hypothetical protein [Actinoplanes sp. URMC 104]|uniref:hypothetical protein n=1 Tax=Actinoplanes sp. URMC 104 TaxID=3423409 RepID=UPI003F19C120